MSEDANKIAEEVRAEVVDTASDIVPDVDFDDAFPVKVEELLAEIDQLSEELDAEVSSGLALYEKAQSKLAELRAIDQTYMGEAGKYALQGKIDLIIELFDE